MNTKLTQGGVQQWVSNVKFGPVDENSSAFFYMGDCKITVNANGELVVLNEEDLVDANFRCLGPKEQDRSGPDNVKNRGSWQG